MVSLKPLILCAETLFIPPNKTHMKYLNFYLTALLLLLTQVSFGQNIHYVTPDGAGTNDGSSWENATDDLHGALSKAEDGDQVWLKHGVYTPTTCDSCLSGDRRVSFVVSSEISIYGGFNGTEQSVAERILVDSFATILSGRINSKTDTADSHTVLLINQASSKTVLDGLTIQDGLADDEMVGKASFFASGALLYIADPDTSSRLSLQVRNVNFKNGRAANGYGGAIYADGSFGRYQQIVIENCKFDSCIAQYDGGAAFFSGNFNGTDSSFVQNSTFRANRSMLGNGGAICFNGNGNGRSYPEIKRSTFENNTATVGHGGALYFNGVGGFNRAAVSNSIVKDNSAKYGGGISIEGSRSGNSMLYLKEVAIENNESSIAGGGLYISGEFGGAASYEIQDCLISNNNSFESGGGIYFNGQEGICEGVLLRTNIVSNRAGQFAAGFFNFGKAGKSNPTLVNCIVAKNRSARAGGMMCLGSENGQAEPLIVNSAFVNNYANVGGAFYSNDTDSTAQSSPKIYNTIFQGNVSNFGSTRSTPFGNPKFYHCAFDVDSCTALTNGIVPTTECTSSNIFKITNVFVDTASNNYNLLDSTGLVDAGVDSIYLLTYGKYDLNGQVRFRGNAIDLGPLESKKGELNWAITNLPKDLHVCQGEQVDLSAEVSGIYQPSTVWYIVGNDTIMNSNEVSVVIDSSIQGLFLIALGTDTLSQDFQITVDEPVIPTLAFKGNLLDTICLGDTLYSTIELTPDTNVVSILWTNEQKDSLGNTRTIATSFDTSGVKKIFVDVTFAGRCLADTTKQIDYPLYVKDCTVGTKGLLFAENIRVFPNPVEDDLFFSSLEIVEPTSYTIYNSIGKLVSTGMISDVKQPVKIMSLTPGMYLIHISQHKKQFVGKFIKN